MSESPALVWELIRRLPGRKVFVLGDSTYGSCSVDEVAADHYGSDCIIHVGGSDQTYAGALPVLFVYGRSHISVAVNGDTQLHGSVVLVGDSSDQIAQVASAFSHLDVYVATPVAEAKLEAFVPRWRDVRFGAVPLGVWWAPLGSVTMAATALPDPLCICAREVRAASGAVLQRLPLETGLVHVGAQDSVLLRRLLLRYGHERPVWQLDPHSGASTRMTSESLLLKRHRFVELARNAATMGLLISPEKSRWAHAVADRLELLLWRAGRRVYRFIIGRVTVEKLANFPEVDCYVSLASPDNFPFDTRDFMQPIVSPFEVEVALKIREWTGAYLTEFQEILSIPLPNCALSEDVVMSHADYGLVRPNLDGLETKVQMAPALLTMGLDGIASSYTTEAQLGSEHGRVES
uniref:Uncharacterized protein n=1 Tax=Noctiluca scintillans TaxID=2966 RepID=A0A7S0ZUP7_NOCSC